MYLKSLVLKGFKSFADRSALSLEPGITAVVGPNGSGKSNISDAVLWVLGERNAKNLRGQAMEDVIFAGSSARKSVGLAEVDLVLDNTDGTLPVDYSEVAITRRMYRSGESEYLINGTPARRMDVLDILHDTGLGTGTHSIISQGSLDSILQSKPEDRRALIEEAAGVLKHKQRKAKSERKLAAMDQHLARAGDVAAEVARQLGPLERKAKRALAYQDLAAELAELNLALAVDDLRVLRRSWDEACTREATLAAELEVRREAITVAEARAEELQERIHRENVDAGELARSHRRAAAALERFDSTTMLLREKRRSAQDRATELAVEREAAAARREAAQAERASASAQLAEAQTERAQADQRVEGLAAEHAAQAERRRALERETAALVQERRDTERALEAARREQTETQEALASGLAHAKLIDGHRKELELQLERARVDAEERASAATQGAHALKALEADEAAARARVGEAHRTRETTREVLDAARDEASALSSEIKGLEEVERASAAAAGPAAAWLLEHADDIDAGLAPLAHALSAPPGREALVERLLGADVAALLVDDAARISDTARALAAQGDEGEVVLVVRADVSACADERPVALAHPEAAPGVPLVAELSYSAPDARAVAALLGDVVVCADLDEALAAHAIDELGLRFATPEGAIVWPSGKVVLGTAVADGEEGVLARHRHLEELRTRLDAASAMVERAQDAAEATEEALRVAQAESLGLSQKLAEERGRAEAARAEAARAEEKLAAVRRELEDVERQRSEAEAAIADARPNVEVMAARVEELGHAIEQTAERLAAAQDAAAPLADEARATDAALAEAKLAAATLAERESYTARVVEARSRVIDEADRTDAEALATLARKQRATRRVEPLLSVFEALAESARIWTRDLEQAASAAQDSSAGLHDSSTAARAAAREAHDAFDAISSRLSEARVEKGRLEVQVDAAVGAISTDLKTPIETALALPPLENRPEVEDRAFKLRRRIANMGTINPDAAEEYEQLKTRSDYLSGQLADLEGARRALAKINRVIDARMKDDFIRTFEAVNANFSEIFAVLFPGGAAKLSLVDPDDLENTGVEVTAQPRGKRITKMMLMSGGEKSLTALALLFAVYRIRATPFYILDEVEAALDDTNLRRLTGYLSALREKTQLIMITHQRRTMEMADVLFGVSMQADGVTKVISQKLEHALENAE